MKKLISLYIEKDENLVTEKIDVFRLGDDHVEVVESFIFLGSKIEVSGPACTFEALMLKQKLAHCVQKTKVWINQPCWIWLMEKDEEADLVCAGWIG